MISHALHKSLSTGLSPQFRTVYNGPRFNGEVEMDEIKNSQESDKKGKEKKVYKFDDLLRLTGGFGRYQMALYAFLCLVSIPTGAQIMIQVFYGASPRFSCVSMPGNETCDPGKCCSNCKNYEFRGPFTSAVSEVNAD